MMQDDEPQHYKVLVLLKIGAKTGRAFWLIYFIISYSAYIVFRINYPIPQFRKRIALLNLPTKRAKGSRSAIERGRSARTSAKLAQF